MFHRTLGSTVNSKTGYFLVFRLSFFFFCFYFCDFSFHHSFPSFLPTIFLKHITTFTTANYFFFPSLFFQDVISFPETRPSIAHYGSIVQYRGLYWKNCGALIFLVAFPCMWNYWISFTCKFNSYLETRRYSKRLKKKKTEKKMDMQNRKSVGHKDPFLLTGEGQWNLN